jgi:hypothetical protein
MRFAAFVLREFSLAKPPLQRQLSYRSSGVSNCASGKTLLQFEGIAPIEKDSHIRQTV